VMKDKMCFPSSAKGLTCVMDEQCAKTTPGSKCVKSMCN
jgi:hypothetical protein